MKRYKTSYLSLLIDKEYKRELREKEKREKQNKKL